MNQYIVSKWLRIINFLTPNTKKAVIGTRLGYLISGAIFMVLAFVALRDFLYGNSFYIYRDVVWPTANIDLLTNSLYSLDLEYIRRIIFLGPFFLTIKLLGISTLGAEKILFLLIRFFMGFFAYVGVYNFISSKIKNIDKNVIFLVSIFSGFFYAYNPTATTMVSPTVFFAFSYSLLPLVLYFFDKSLNEGKFYNIFIAGTLISLCLAGVTQFLVLVPLFILIPWLIVIGFKRGKQNLLNTIKNASLVLMMWFLTSFYYILVTFLVYFQGIKLQPSYVVTYDALNMFSNGTTLINVIRLMGDWWPRINLEPILNSTIWVPLTFIIPITIILLLFFARNSKLRFYLLSLCLISLLVIFVHKGSQPPIPDFYPLLYNLPIIGWMFRVPSKFAMILSFFAMMILTLGFYHLFASKTSRLKTYLKYIFLGGFVISVSVISWPMFVGDLGGTYRNGEYPENMIPDQAKNTQYLSVPTQVVGILGGLDKVRSLNSLESSDFNNSSLIFFDQNIGTNLINMTPSDKLIFDHEQDLIMQMLPKNSIIVKPFDATNRHDPKSVWSKAGTNDPSQGPFHQYLDKFSIRNSDIDYGKGLVFTWANDSLDIPTKIENTDRYTMFARYLENEQGGTMKVYVDKHPFSTINSLDQHSRFVWRNIGEIYLTHGQHTINLENIRGLNAVNIFVLVQSQQIPVLLSEVHNLAQKTRNIRILEAESDFDPVGGSIREDQIFSSAGGTFNKTFENEFIIPENTHAAILQFSSKPDPNSPSSYRVKSFMFGPVSHNKNIFGSDFEDGSNQSKFYSSLGKNEISLETKTPISGTKSLRIDMNGDPEANLWNIVTTEPMLIESEGNLNFQMSLHALGAKLLQSKVIYYDSNFTEIVSRHLSVDANHNSKNKYSMSITSPEAAKYFSLQFWARPNSSGLGSYLVDDIKVDQAYPDRVLKDNFEFFGNSFSDGKQNVTVNTDDLKVSLKSRNSSLWNAVETTPIPVTGGIVYRYAITVQTDNINSLQSKVLFLRQMTENSSSYGIQNGILTMKPGSEILTNLDLLKASKYTIATRVKTCETCSSMTIKIGDNEREFYLWNSITKFKWLYLTEELPVGRTDLRLYSDGATELDKIIVYSDSYNNESVDKLFEPDKLNRAMLLNYNELNPTKFQVNIDAIKPFILELNEPYNPLWSAEVNGVKYKPIQIYSKNAAPPGFGIVSTSYPAINGFIIDQKGKLNLTVEYLPLKWFQQGIIVTFLAYVFSVTYLIWEHRQSVHRLLIPFKTRVLSFVRKHRR